MQNFSRFGRRITSKSGIGELMEDLGTALGERPDMLMLGGGNPAHIAEVERRWRESMEGILSRRGEFEKLIGDYDPPGGNREFIRAMSALLNNEFGWKTKPENIVLTTGSQTAFFVLFNIFGGDYADGSKKKIFLPLTPEYIGYSDVGLSEDLFTANRPKIEYLGEHLFKYHVDFEAISVSDEIGAMCVSRPTNPSGNVLTDDEVGRLSDMAKAHGVPLIIDGAYGSPFPNIVFTEGAPLWNDNTIMCLSLSKLGLPATRTGIVAASAEIVAMVRRANAIMTLAPGGIGAAMTLEMVRSGEIVRLSREVIRPFYEQKMRQAVELLGRALDGLDYRVHKPEGAFFLWLWLEGLAISNAELYERLKRRGVLVVCGHYFFPGLGEDWRHKYECIRINYSQDEAMVSRAIEIIGEEVRAACGGAKS
jgi:valine--pyruvate aminotransferase